MLLNCAVHPVVQSRKLNSLLERGRSVEVREAFQSTFWKQTGTQSLNTGTVCLESFPVLPWDIDPARPEAMVAAEIPALLSGARLTSADVLKYVMANCQCEGVILLAVQL